MDSPNPKRLRHVPSITSSSSSLPIAPDFNQSELDSTISSFLSLLNLPLFSSPLSIGCTFDRVLDKVITSATGTSGDEFDEDRFLDHTLQLASLLHKSTKRCIRKRATVYNSISWLLLPELTIKVFSLLDTKSLVQASACCTMFKKCAMDRVCYTHINLTMAAKPVDNGAVSIMIHRAGKELRSLKLGSIDGSTMHLLTRSCLTPLSSDNGFAGGLLRSLHLYNLELMDRKSLCAVLSACSNLTDLKIVGFAPDDRIHPLEQLLLLTKNCGLLEQLHLETSSSAVLKTANSTLVEVVDHYCPNLTSLSLLRFGVTDEIAKSIIKGFRKLKHLNLSRTTGIHGSFLRCEELSCIDSPLETLILRNCYGLKEREVSLFLNSLLDGDFKSIRYIDVSNDYGVATNGRHRTFDPNYPIAELKKQRSDVIIVADFVSPPSRLGELHPEDNSSGSSIDLSEDEEDEDESYDDDSSSF